MNCPRTSQGPDGPTSNTPRKSHHPCAFRDRQERSDRQRWASHAWNTWHGTSVPAVLLALLLGFLATPRPTRAQDQSAAAPAPSTSAQETVGHQADGQIVTPVNQILTPAGQQVDLPRMRPQALALHPRGIIAVTAGKTSELVVINPAGGEILQRVALPNDDQRTPETLPPSANILKPDEDGQVSYTGLIFSPQGDRIYMSNVEGTIKVFQVSHEGNVTPSHAWPLPPANVPRRQAEIPSGLAVSPDGTLLYVCGNLSNRLLVLNTSDGSVVAQVDVGVAPYDVVLAAGKAYVSNWGGRRPSEGDVTGPAGRGTLVRVDPVRFIASEGSVTIVDTTTRSVLAERLTGLHASGLAKTPDERFVVCANAGSDHVSVISTESNDVVATLWTKTNPADLLGASPNAVQFDESGKRLYVANGAQNAIAVINFLANEPEDSALAGLIPVGWYPGALVIDNPRQKILVANIKGIARIPRQEKSRTGFNSHHYWGSLSLVPIPSDADLPPLSQMVTNNLRRPRIVAALQPPRPNQPPRAIPERIGEPSKIKHVVYIIKENRTYDQVFGALPRGNGDPSLCIFGSQVTPNHHKIAEEFVLLDNAYCAGILSADGHQWSTTAFSTDYMEKSFASFPRSYPDGMGEDEMDALAYSPAGFLWDHAVANKITLRNYGEFMAPAVRWRDASRSGTPDFAACFQAWRDKTDDVVFASYHSVESLKGFSPTEYVGWEMSVPDQFRADFIIRELQQFEARGEYPQLTIICLPNDHTSGTSPKCPTPEACMADNDLAFGRIVEALSHSRFWPEMAIFAIEDDPQNGWDHVTGYRTIAFCASPFAKRGALVSTQYNTTSILRTIEQILGIKPMNQFDASAEPMFDCFVEQPDTRPYIALPTNIPLDTMNPDPKAIHDPQLREDALVSASLNFREVDRAPEDVLNRILWRSVRGTQIPYPEWAITLVEDDDDEEEEEAVQVQVD